MNVNSTPPSNSSSASSIRGIFDDVEELEISNELLTPSTSQTNSPQGKKPPTQLYSLLVNKVRDGDGYKIVKVALGNITSGLVETDLFSGNPVEIFESLAVSSPSKTVKLILPGTILTPQNIAFNVSKVLNYTTDVRYNIIESTFPKEVKCSGFVMKTTPMGLCAEAALAGDEFFCPKGYLVKTVTFGVSSVADFTGGKCDQLEELLSQIIGLSGSVMFQKNYSTDSRDPEVIKKVISFTKYESYVTATEYLNNIRLYHLSSTDIYKFEQACIDRANKKRAFIKMESGEAGSL